MKVLISAYACAPGKGSEPGVGWNVIRELSQHHEICVLTRARHREAVLNSGEKWIDRVNWVFIDPPRWLTFWKVGSRGLYPFYFLWQLSALKSARKLEKEHGFDIVHHLTFGQYWVPTPLADLGPPFVNGPVGGGESNPPGFSEHYSTRGKFHELLRDAVRQWFTRIPFIRSWFRRAAWTFATTNETARALQELGVENLEVLPQSGIGDGDEIQRFCATREAKSKSLEGPLKLVAASRLVHWKGVNLAIEAVARARALGVPVELIILQEGQERENLERLTVSLGVSDVVTFEGKLPRIEDVFEMVADADALIHPALHEAFGQSCLEAMTLGTPVICLAWGGPGLIVSKETGYPVVPRVFEQTLDDLADAIRRCYQDKKKGVNKGTGAAKRAQEVFTWSKKVKRINEVYAKVCAQSD